MADDQEMCLICYEDIFQKPIAALCCGHVYHRECITGWLRASKLPGDQGECPQCKQRTAVDEMRLLEYDTVAPLQSSVVELLAERSGTSKQRQRTQVDLCQQWQQTSTELPKSREERLAAELEAEECKLQRRGLQENSNFEEEELAVLREERQERQCRCAEMRAHLDIQNQKHGKLKLPVLARQEQEALEEERRKLRQVGPHERSQLLHSALVSALRQEADAQRLSLDRQKAAEEAELMMSRLRQEVEKLRQQVEVMQAVERTCQRMDDRSEARQVSKVKGTSLAEFKRQLSRSYSNLSISSESASPWKSNRDERPPSSPESIHTAASVDQRPVATPSGSKRSMLWRPEEEEEDMGVFDRTAKRPRKAHGFGKATRPERSASGTPTPTGGEPPTGRLRVAQKSNSLKVLFGKQ